MTVSIRNLTDTWNSGGTTFSAIKMDVTDSSSAAASKLLDLLVGASEKFAVTKAGLVRTAGAVNITSTASTALAAGPSGTTNPTIQVDASTSSAATGIKITGAAAAGGVALAAISSGTNEGLSIDAKGSGTITLNGTGTGNITTPRGLVSTGTAGVGYATGAGGTVTQATNRTTGVTINKTTGAITLVSAAGSTTPATFTVTNSTVAATDVVVLSQKSGTDLYDLSVTAVAAGSFNITFNTKSGTTTEQPVINFAVIKGVAA